MEPLNKGHLRDQPFSSSVERLSSFTSDFLWSMYKYILLHDWEGNTGEYSVQGWQYWPERSEGQYRSRELNIPPYCPTQRSAVIDLLYDLHTALLPVHAQGSSL